ncbi:hypothetical protein FPV67DRAFT_1376586, partial [Lyophyllum atratum]
LPLPLAAFLAIWILSIMITGVFQTLRGTFAPLCYLPGLYGSRLCHTQLPTDVIAWADYPRLTDIQSFMLKDLLDESAAGSGLSLEIKRAQLATADLVTLVRISDLESRDTLSDLLKEFAEDAKKTGRDLQRLSSKIGGAVDNIMAANDYALHQIEAAYLKSQSLSTMYGVAPWAADNPTKEALTRTFGEVMGVLADSMQRLIIEAEVNLANLEKLEERLSVLHELVAREDATISSAKSELLAELWTKLGGNKKKLHNYQGHLELLKNLGLYRKRALAHVVGALQSLTAITSDMEEMRERVAAPELAGSHIPVEVHMNSIKVGIERLREGRERSKRLEESAIGRVLGIVD